MIKTAIISMLIILGVYTPPCVPVPPEVNTEGLCTYEVSETACALSEPITFTATAYCGCEDCCGKSDCITATGTRATQGRTIAADPNVLPYGTQLLIDGKCYVVEDCGGGINGNRLDIYFESHADALNFGVQTVTAQILQR